MSDIKIGETVQIDGKGYEVLYVTNPKRVVVRYDGDLLVSLDFKDGAGWQLGANAEDEREKAFIKVNMPAQDTTEVDIVKD